MLKNSILFSSLLLYVRTGWRPRMRKVQHHFIYFFVCEYFSFHLMENKGEQWMRNGFYSLFLEENLVNKNEIDKSCKWQKDHAKNQVAEHKKSSNQKSEIGNTDTNCSNFNNNSWTIARFIICRWGKFRRDKQRSSKKFKISIKFILTNNHSGNAIVC